jgi:hypothetical protein
VTSPQQRPTQPVEYKGEPLDAARGPGLGCFWLQMIVLGALVVLTPASVSWGWPSAVSAVLLFAVILLLLFTGQTMIFLLRLVAAGRSEGRRRPLASPTPTVGELEDEAPGADAEAAAPGAGDGGPADGGAAETADGPGDEPSGMRQ